MKKVLFFSAILFILPTYASAATIYVQSVKAPVKDSPSFSAKTLWTAQRGDRLNYNKKKGDWYLTKNGHQKGWVSSFLVSDQPPMGKISRLAKTNVSLSRSARRRPSSYTTAAAARGLAEERARKGQTRYRANYSDLDRVESYSFDESRLSKFLNEGGLQ